MRIRFLGGPLVLAALGGCRLIAGISDDVVVASVDASLDTRVDPPPPDASPEADAPPGPSDTGPDAGDAEPDVRDASPDVPTDVVPDIAKDTSDEVLPDVLDGGQEAAPVVEAPTFDPPAGVYASPMLLKVTSASPGAKVYVRAPDVNGTALPERLVSGSLPLMGSVEFTAWALSDNGVSPTVTASYTLPRVQSRCSWGGINPVGAPVGAGASALFLANSIPATEFMACGGAGLQTIAPTVKTNEGQFVPLEVSNLAFDARNGRAIVATCGQSNIGTNLYAVSVGDPNPVAAQLLPLPTQDCMGAIVVTDTAVFWSTLAGVHRANMPATDLDTPELILPLPSAFVSPAFAVSGTMLYAFDEVAKAIVSCDTQTSCASSKTTLVSAQDVSAISVNGGRIAYKSGKNSIHACAVASTTDCASPIWVTDAPLFAFDSLGLLVAGSTQATIFGCALPGCFAGFQRAGNALPLAMSADDSYVYLLEKDNLAIIPRQ